jgi:hypothetical protein
MDDFVVYNNTFDKCLYNLDQVLQECRKAKLVLNWERCCFMIGEGKVFEHKISEKVIEIDKSGLEPLKELPKPRDVKGLQKFVGHDGFYRRFIKNFYFL